MANTSGGITTRWRRKRGRAARLRPVVEDSASTTRLFNGHANGHTGNGRADAKGRSENGSPRARRAPRIVHDGSSAPVPAAPILRYEWHSRAGDTLVVEAAWPGPEPPVESGRPRDAAESPVELRL